MEKHVTHVWVVLLEERSEGAQLLGVTSTPARGRQIGNRTPAVQNPPHHEQDIQPWTYDRSELRWSRVLNTVDTITVTRVLIDQPVD